MGQVYKSICNEADILLGRVMYLTEKEIRYKLEIEKIMNKGFVNIAKARYIMGSTCVTKMQLPTANSNPIRPVATVSRAEYDKHWVFQVRRKDVASSCERMPDDDVQETDDPDGKLILEEDGECEKVLKNLIRNDPKALRRSKKAFGVKDSMYKDYNEELLDELSSDSTESLVSVTDPIRLFGILVPNTLKDAQIFFVEVIDLVGKCATIQSQLEDALGRYAHLDKVKRLIEGAAAGVKVDILKPRVYWTPAESTSSSSLSVYGYEGENNQEIQEEKPSLVSVKKSIRSVFFTGEPGQKRFTS